MTDREAIKRRIAGNGLRNWQVAEHIGVSEAHFSRQLRHPTQEFKKRIEQFLDEYEALQEEDQKCGRMD